MRQNMENYIIQVLSYLKITNYLESEQNFRLLCDRDFKELLKNTV